MRMLSGAEGDGPPARLRRRLRLGYENLKSFSKAFQARYRVIPRAFDATFQSEARWETRNTLLSRGSGNSDVAVVLPGRVLDAAGIERDCAVRCGSLDALEVAVTSALAPGGRVL